MTLTELKQTAAQLGITPDMARSYGHIGHKSTWQAAIEATRQEWDAAANDDELDEPTPVTSQPTQYGPELVFIIPALLLILTAQLIWRGIRYVWPPVSRWLYHEGIGCMAAAALLLYRPKLV